MEENKLEELDKMFQHGYLIIYTCNDGQIRMSMNNPHRDRTIFDCYDMLVDFVKESE